MRYLVFGDTGGHFRQLYLALEEAGVEGTRIPADVDTQPHHDLRTGDD